MSHPTMKELLVAFEAVSSPYTNDSGTVYRTLEEGLQAIYVLGANEAVAKARLNDGIAIRHIEGETHGSVSCNTCGTLFGYHSDDARVYEAI